MKTAQRFLVLAHPDLRIGAALATVLDKALASLKSEADEGKLDADLLDVFIAKRVYEAAASYRPDVDLLMGAENR
jgi:hypothetical protein